MSSSMSSKKMVGSQGFKYQREEDSHSDSGYNSGYSANGSFHSGYSATGNVTPRLQETQQMPKMENALAKMASTLGATSITTQQAAPSTPEKSSSSLLDLMFSQVATPEAEKETFASPQVPPVDQGDRFLFQGTRDKAQVYYVKAKDGTMQIAGNVGESIVTLLAPYKAKAELALQPLKPYYVKVENGVASILAKIDSKTVVIRVKISNVYGSVQERIIKAINAARVTIEPYTGPAMARAISLRDRTRVGVDRFKVSIEGGVIRFKGAVGDRIVFVQTQLSEIIDSICAKEFVKGPMKAISDLSVKLAAFASKTYGQVCETVSVVSAKTKNGFLHIAFKVDRRFIILRIKVTEVVEFLQAKSTTLRKTAIKDIYDDVKVKVLNAADVARTKSIEFGANARSLAGNQKAQVTAASAAGGAVALGASGGAAGLVAGGGVGLILAPFTFGLSIPVGATVGAGAGVCIGGTTGLVTGGAAGYGAHKHKDKIGDGVNGALSKAKAYKAIAADSTSKLRAQVIASTGGSFA